MSGAQLDHGQSKMQKDLTFYLLLIQRGTRIVYGQIDGHRTKGDRIGSTGLRSVELKNELFKF